MKKDEYFFDDKAILSLFDFKIEPHLNYKVNMNLQVLYIKKLPDLPDSTKKMHTATLRDALYKYNGFIFVSNIDSPEIHPESICNITQILPTKFTNQPSRAFIIKEFQILSSLKPTFSREAMLVKDENGEVSYTPAKGREWFISGEKINEFQDCQNENSQSEVHKTTKENTYQNLNQLNSFSREFSVFVRVVKKGEMKFFKKKLEEGGEGKVFYFIVIDKEGTEMQINCFNEHADAFYSKIKEGFAYEIRNGTVKINDSKYTKSRSNYKIVLNENSSIIERNDRDLINLEKCKFIKLKDIKYMSTYTIINLCLVVLEVGEKCWKVTKVGSQRMRKLIVGDSSGYKTELVLWNDNADLEINKEEFLILRSGKVGNYAGKQIIWTFQDTKILKDPKDSNEVNELKQYIKEGKGFIDFDEEHKQLVAKQKIIVEKKADITKIFYLQDLLNSLEESDIIQMSKARVTITQIWHNEKNFYLGCPNKNCKRKISKSVKKNDKYLCLECNNIFEKPMYYYTLNIRVKDCSCDTRIDVFGGPAEYLIKSPVEEYKNFVIERNVKKLIEISRDVEFKEFFIWVKSRVCTYQSNTKKKIFAAKIEEIDLKEEARATLDKLNKILKLK